MSFKKISKVAGALSAAAALAFTAAPSASAASGNQLQNQNGVCLGSQNGANDTHAIVWGCNGNPDQTWHGVYVGGAINIVNGNGQCLGVNDSDQAMVWDCNGNSDQRWTWGPANAWGTVINANGACLGTQGGVSAPGTYAIIWGCNGNPDQEWG
ncbi:RICIN domain-containing protein [Kitasatospora sp. NBC_01302]|uniref:RICIN domain-containing protein n=1 Tax=Kitasatospora sp. NBC_01302 TaxID=2903575 RepID=UPI002E127B07|nr:ricin-type beta-trefoil lectin domain protein [Kitasatospora sp. NBC_01302]